MFGLTVALWNKKYKKKKEGEKEGEEEDLEEEGEIQVSDNVLKILKTFVWCFRKS